MTGRSGFDARGARTRERGAETALAQGARLLAARRVKASAAYPEMDTMRDRARAIRLEVLGRLADHLASFADRAEGVGATVFWADDAAEANRYVTELAQAHEVSLAVKSKSMVTEEIQLNDACEAAGIDIVETDLGELIVQLSHDRPSHIIAPVLHRTRFEVGDLFAEKLGVPPSSDPATLNATARRHLRRRFLTAGMGISGVNFAVAETGSICLVTNEGNGRLVSTAPRLHVAVMGMERLVPTVADLGVMLEVLARSATGQRLSVYTNLITGPRRPDDPDGPEELHIVIVDNGRSRVLAGAAAEALACIRCGACLNVCPVYRHTGGHVYESVYPGPIGAVLSPALFGLDAHADLPHASSLCGACLEACPVRIDLPGLLVAMRREVARQDLAPSGLARAVRLFATAASRPRLWRGVLGAGSLAGRLRTSWLDTLPGPGSGWTDHRAFPPPAARPFRARWKEHRDGA